MNEKRRLYMVEYRVRNRAHAAAQTAKWRKANPEKDKATKKRWYEKHREEVSSYSARTQRAKSLARRYGITEEQYSEQLTLQDDRCAICRRFAPEGKFLFVDYGPLGNRGLLCFSCNVSLGHFGDSVETLQKAIEYLQNPPWSAA